MKDLDQHISFGIKLLNLKKSARENGSSVDGLGSDSDEESGNNATISLTEETEPMRGDVIKAKMPGFKKSVQCSVKGSDKYFQERLTITRREHLKRNFAKEVKIIDSELSEYPGIEKGYKLYGLGWTSGAPDSYFPNMVPEFYANFAVTLENMCKKGHKVSEMPISTKVQVRGV
ncbi:hypothetical protein HAX54_031569 [Datura stramonium]|uniref:Uncharacterized protein n=1 Tax=Datura stramonium TaxID=4076 RepID=A0ABS8RLM2_DATST|nr:hypothetical protein [Datura stramonium]